MPKPFRMYGLFFGRDDKATQVDALAGGAACRPETQNYTIVPIFQYRYKLNDNTMKLQFDPLGLGDVVERALAQMASGPVQVLVTPPLSPWARGWRYVRRRCVGNWRWQKMQRAEQLRQVLDQIRWAMSASHKPRLVYLAPFVINMLQSGGGRRIAGIAKALSAQFNVFILAPRYDSDACSVVEVAPDCRLVGIPVDPEYNLHYRAHDPVASAGVFYFADYFDLLPTFHEVLNLLGDHADAWGVASPIGWPVVQRYGRAQCPVYYDAHDDYSQYLQISFGCEDGRLVRRLVELEGDALEHATVASFCTASDLEAARLRYPASAGKMRLVPNGVDAEASRFVPPAQGLIFRAGAGMMRNLAVFVGAHHKPNLEAIDRIVAELAPAFPSVGFVVVGIHYAAYRANGGAEPGENVVFTGPVAEDIKEAIFAMAAVALAPMKSGTGSSLKIPDYVAHGKVVVGTPIGLRGFEGLLQFPSLVADEDLRGALARVLDQLERNSDEFNESCLAARKWIETHLDWSVAAKPLLDLLEVVT
jgi:glycosyltransferase involved in cell wall biosynthesis